MTGRAAYLQLADALRSKIRSGELPPGAALPSLSQLIAEYKVSNTVVRSALQVLRSEGLTVGQQGKGVFVRETLPEIEENASPEFVAIMQRLDEMSEGLRQLADRVSDLENAESPRDGKSAPRSRRSAPSSRRSEKSARPAD